MSENFESNIYSENFSEEIKEKKEKEALSALDSETPLTMAEISAARSEQTRDHNFNMRKYKFEDVNVSILRENLYLENFKNSDHEKRVIGVLKNKEEGEIAHNERLLVNVLVEQARIAKKFKIPKKGLYLSMKLDYFCEGDFSMGSFGDIHVLSLMKHIETLKKRGATENQIIIELAGHVFHEAVHQGEEGLDDALLDGNHALGEVTPITSQLAYYFEKNYRGPRSYDDSFFKRGIEKINDDKDSVTDHDIATCVSAEILLQRLITTYSEIAEEIETDTGFEACEKILDKIPLEKKELLMPCLKEAIKDSTDLERFKAVIEKLKKNKEPKEKK